jgi:hypothetical protein
MLNKAIEHGKEYRKQYTGAKLCDRTCRNHGSCPQCKQNRTFSFTRNNWWSKQELEEYSWYSEEEADEYEQGRDIDMHSLLFSSRADIN